VNARDEEEEQPLHYASENAYLVIAKALLKAGADIESGNGNKNTPLLLAIQHKKTAMVRLLVEAGAQVNGRGALGYAAYSPGDGENIKILLKAGAKLNDLDEYGYRPLHRAIESGHLSDPATLTEQLNALILLLKAGADANAPNGNKITPLALASKLYTNSSYVDDRHKEEYLGRFKAIEKLLREYGAK
jgi:ankyrin repeat protein